MYKNSIKNKIKLDFSLGIKFTVIALKNNKKMIVHFRNLLFLQAQNNSFYHYGICIAATYS